MRVAFKKIVSGINIHMISVITREVTKFLSDGGFHRSKLPSRSDDFPLEPFMATPIEPNGGVKFPMEDRGGATESDFPFDLV